MTRPYTESERTDPDLNKPEWTDRFGEYVFSASPHWPSSKAVASNITIGAVVCSSGVTAGTLQRAQGEKCPTCPSMTCCPAWQLGFRVQG
jgi:hypothetical protein